MSEPPRLREHFHGPVECVLLEAGRSFRASDRTRAKALAALGLSASAAIGASSAAATSASSAAAAIGSSASHVAKLGWAGTGWAKLALSVATFGAVAAPVAYMVLPAHQPAAHAVMARSSTPPSRTMGRNDTDAPDQAGTGPQDQALSREMPASAPTTVDDIPAPSDVRRASSESGATQNTGAIGAGGRSYKAPPRGGTSAVLGVELAMVEGARSLLAAGDAHSALSVLDTYSRMYPHGHLELETEVLRIDAMAKSGQPTAAKKRAEVFLRRHPNSVLASRVRGYLAL